MLLSLTAICVAVAVVSLPVLLRMKRIRDQREMEQHSISVEDLHSLLTYQEVLLFDVRQPLDLLANPEIIPGAQRLTPTEVLERPSLIPREKRRGRVLYLSRRENQPSNFASSSCPAFLTSQIPQRWIGSLESEGLSGRTIQPALPPLTLRNHSALGENAH